MTHPSRGRVLIINIKAFYVKARLSEVREGSTVDFDNLSRLFKDLKFEKAKLLENLNGNVSCILFFVAFNWNKSLHHFC